MINTSPNFVYHECDPENFPSKEVKMSHEKSMESNRSGGVCCCHPQYAYYNLVIIISVISRKIDIRAYAVLWVFL